MTRDTRPDLLDRRGTKGIREIPGSGQVDLSCCPHDRRRGRQGRYRKADARLGLGLVRDCAAVPGQCVPSGLRVPEEIDPGFRTPQREIETIENRLKRLKE